MIYRNSKQNNNMVVIIRFIETLTNIEHRNTTFTKLKLSHCQITLQIISYRFKRFEVYKLH